MMSLHFWNFFFLGGVRVCINIYNIIFNELHFFEAFFIKNCQRFQGCFKISSTFDVLDNIEVPLNLFYGLRIKNGIWMNFLSTETATT